MTEFPAVLHPTFEGLSAHADTSDDVASATRVGRHVERCERCRAVVTEIRALGSAARAMVVAGAPADLWSRIEAAAAAPRRPDAVRLPLAPADLPAPASRRHRALITGACILAVAVAAAVWPRPSSLQAAGPSRLTFSPTRPVPGGMVRVTYQPATWMKDAQRLLVVGRFARPAGANPKRLGASVFAQLADSLGVLTRGPDGAFVATLQLPTDFLAVELAVVDPVRDEIDVDGSTPWIIIGGTRGRAPSLASLLAAQDIRPSWYEGDRRGRPRQLVDVADSLKRHFPRHPAGWALSRSYGVSSGRFDLLRFFQSAERKYASMHDELWPQRGLDAERLHDMVVFATHIDEPEEVLRWSARLVEEHPEDPRALYDLTDALHQIELRPLPGRGDTIRKWMPALDRAYRAGPIPNQGFDEALRLAVSYGDSSTKALWRGRSNAHVGIRNTWLLTRRSPRLEGDSVDIELRMRAERGCARPSGRYPLTQPIAEWRRWCELHRSLAYGYLSVRSLDDGRVRMALTEADSGIVTGHRSVSCGLWPAYLAHASASLALGDTLAAERDFAFLSATDQRRTAVLDTLRLRLGPSFDPARLRPRVDSVRRSVVACDVAARARTEERERRLGG